MRSSGRIVQTPNAKPRSIWQKRIQDAVITGKGSWETIAVPDNVRRQADTPYFQSVLTFDPDKVMKDVAQPVLILAGSLIRRCRQATPTS